jgi:ACT domain-containing protein
MMMIVDISKMDIDFVTFIDEITRIGEDKGVQVRCQREDIFDKMHRI